MYIIKLNHLIKIYIDLIYYLKQRYICYAYISFNSKIYDILHGVSEDGWNGVGGAVGDQSWIGWDLGNQMGILRN